MSFQQRVSLNNQYSLKTTISCFIKIKQVVK